MGKIWEITDRKNKNIDKEINRVKSVKFPFYVYPATDHIIYPDMTKKYIQPTNRKFLFVQKKICKVEPKYADISLNISG